MSRHTPGPWNPIVCGVAGPKANVGDAIFFPADAERPESELRANAALAAAAPEMLEALKWTLEALEASDMISWPNGNGWDASAFKNGLSIVRRTIARAEGKRTKGQKVVAR